MDRLVRTTHLEMTDRSQAIPHPGERKLKIQRVETDQPEQSRSLYRSVGDGYWFEHREWTREQWVTYADQPELQTWVARLAGEQAGYFELDFQPKDQIEIPCFGLLPAYIGRGLGMDLLAQAIECAWQTNPHRVWLNTCTLDHPRALTNYQAAGFTIFKTEEAPAHFPK